MKRYLWDRERWIIPERVDDLRGVLTVYSLQSLDHECLRRASERFIQLELFLLVRTKAIHLPSLTLQSIYRILVVLDDYVQLESLILRLTDKLLVGSLLCRDDRSILRRPRGE